MILITGATSQVGVILVKKLIESGYKVRCLVRQTSDIKEIKNISTELVYGDVEDCDSIAKALAGVDSVIHIAGIWRASQLVRACELLELKGKVIFIGSTSRFKKLESIDRKEKLLAEKMCLAEEQIKESKLNYIILRPTMLYGIDKDKNILQIIRFMKRYRFYPLIGSGNAFKQPVYVGDVVSAVVSCICNETISRKEYNLAGKQQIRHREMLKTIRRSLPFKAFILRVPVFTAYIAIFIYKLIKPSSYINYAMVKRVNENMSYDIERAELDLGYAPVDFETGVKKQISYLVENGVL
jgi:nucleoside-diphosphate-sugar epimerase